MVFYSENFPFRPCTRPRHQRQACTLPKNVRTQPSSSLSAVPTLLTLQPNRTASPSSPRRCNRSLQYIPSTIPTIKFQPAESRDHGIIYRSDTQQDSSTYLKTYDSHHNEFRRNDGWLRGRKSRNGTDAGRAAREPAGAGDG